MRAPLTGPHAAPRLKLRGSDVDRRYEEPVARGGQHMDTDRDTDERREHVTPAEAPRRAAGRAGAAAAGEAAGRRAQVIAATMRLIARDGVAALSTRTLARDVAVTRATLYAHFGHKDDLLLAVLDAATS